MAGRTCVRNVVVNNVVLLRGPRPRNPKPKGRSGATEEKKERKEAQGLRRGLDVRDGSGRSHLKLPLRHDRDVDGQDTSGMSLDGTMMYREKRQEGAATMTQNAKIGQHFVWVMVVRCGEKSPQKPPMKGGSPRCARAPTPKSW